MGLRVLRADSCPQQTELKQGIKIVVDGSELHRALDDAEISGIEGEVEVVFPGSFKLTAFGGKLTDDGLVELLLRKRAVCDLLGLLLRLGAREFGFGRENLDGLGHRGTGAESRADTDDGEES